jgi:predicted SprT family Zn-dependent metalloprotease
MDTKRAQMMAQDMMQHHGLAQQGWVFVWSKQKKANGYSWHAKKTIGLSMYTTPLRKEDDVLNTILHEIAHALLGAAFGHGRDWKLKAIEVGAIPERCANNTNEERPQGKYTLTCQDCGVKAQRYKRPPLYALPRYRHWACLHKTNKGALTMAVNTK